jgi:integrase
LALTGQRLREIADLSWDEIVRRPALHALLRDRDDFAVQVEARQALQQRQSLWRQRHFDGKYVFTLKGGIRPIAGFDRPKKRLDEMSGVEGWRLHDLRRTARSGFSAITDVEDHVREAVLDHRRSGIARVYDLHKYYAEKLALLTAWEKRLQVIVEDAAATTQAA